MVRDIASNAFFMKIALEEAQKAYDAEHVPVGAVLIQKEKVIAKSHNIYKKHAEFFLLQDCTYLDNTDLYVTLEPCCLCAGLISHTRIRRLYFGAYDPKTGFVEHNAQVFRYTHHKPEIIGGILEKECEKLLKDFFLQKRT